MGILSFYPNLKDSVSEYIDTAYLTNNKDFNTAREKLINSEMDSPVFRDPVFEPLKRYVETTTSYEDLVELCNIGDNDSQNTLALKGMLEKIDPIKYGSLYQHQIDSISSAINEGKNIAVTTGTGSGKSFCFQIPMLINIIKEALGSNGRKKWVGVSETGTDWWRQNNTEFSYKRLDAAGDSRKPGIRALLMYPLNALVQDQIDGMREILCSREANNFYSNILGGQKIYFGQYSGSTLGRGSPHPKNYNGIKQNLRSIEKIRSSISVDKLNKVPCLDQSEVITRWDMQKHAPDILITNYSMLSIMLTRDREQEMIAQTKAWLDDNENNIFYLILDELHSYRGTGGTEISYIVKSFIRKLGLTPDHKQLQIIATTASLSPEDGQKFLSDFFGTTEDFKIIDGPEEEVDKDSIKRVASYADKLEGFHASLSDSSFESLYQEFQQEYDVSECNELIKKAGLHDCLLTLSEILRNSEQKKDQITSMPLKISDISDGIFSGNSGAAIGLLEFLTYGHNRLDGAKTKIRIHAFIRNLDGIRRAMIFENNEFRDMFLCDALTPICSRTGTINIDVNYCQECGEIYYSGFKNNLNGLLHIANDPPEEDMIRNSMILFQEYKEKNNYEAESRRFSWETSYINGYSGELTRESKHNSLKIKRVVIDYNNSAQRFDLPSECVSCGANWSTKPLPFVQSPIRTMGTGYNKFSQVVIEQIMRVIREEDPDFSKLVVFSDSRRDAARISADLELNHYLDTVRAVTENILRELSDINSSLDSYIKLLEEISAESGDYNDAKRHGYFTESGSRNDARKLLISYKEGYDEELEKEEIEYVTSLKMKAKSKQVKFYGTDDSLVNRVQTKLLEMGVNPAGLYERYEGGKSYTWQDVYIKGPRSQSDQ